MRLLVADDTPAERRATARLLRRAGHTVLEVNGGKAAIESLANDIDGVVTDLDMPDVNGFSVATECHLRGIPVVIFSGSMERPADSAVFVQKTNHDGLISAVSKFGA